MHGSLDLLVGIQHHLPSGVIHQSYWQTKAQLSLFSFLQFSAQQALPQPMELSLAHGALDYVSSDVNPPRSEFGPFSGFGFGGHGVCHSPCSLSRHPKGDPALTTSCEPWRQTGDPKTA